MATYHIPLFDLGLAMADAVDLMSPVVAGHHTRVAYLASRLGEELGLADADLEDLVLAALLHDIGAFSSDQRLKLLTYDDIEGDHHAELGALFLERFPTFERVAATVHHHHRPWRDSDASTEAELASLLHLADRIDAMGHREGCILSAVDGIVATLRERGTSEYSGDGLMALERLSRRDYVWLDLRSAHLGRLLRRLLGDRVLVLEDGDMLEFARLLSHLVDFRSTYTSTHTAGVACTAALLAHEVGLEPDRCTRIQLAGFLHDLGKLAVPTEILDKPAGLEPSEWALMKTHVYHTRRILEDIPELGEVTDWAAGHHEKLNGTGYPFRETELALETRIMAVADVFTAITEDRPYRSGSAPRTVRDVLHRMVSCHHLDPALVDLALSHQNDLNEVRLEAQRPALATYREMVLRSAETRAGQPYMVLH